MVRPIPLFDLKPQQQEIREEALESLARTLDNCQFILGDEVAAFEKEFAQYCDSSDAIAVNSGTSALHLALLAAGVGPGDEVITVPHTFVATVAAILYCRATPVLVDVDPSTLTMNPDQLQAAITEKTKVILPVHIYGQAANMDAICEIAKQHSLRVIEDAAQAHGARYKGRAVGSIGDLGCFSFYPSKNLGANGEGGAVTTSDPELAARVRALRDWGQVEKGTHDLPGYNYRMDGFQGGVLRAKLKRLPKWTEQRVEIAKVYERGFEELSGTQLVGRNADSTHVFHLMVAHFQNRDRVAAQLKEKGIGTGIHYRLPVHLQPAYVNLGYGPGDFPVAEQAARTILSLPMFPSLTAEEVSRVLVEIKKLAPDTEVADALVGSRA